MMSDDGPKRMPYTSRDSGPFATRIANALLGQGIQYERDMEELLAPADTMRQAADILTELRNVGEKSARPVVEWANENIDGVELYDDGFQKPLPSFVRLVALGVDIDARGLEGQLEGDGGPDSIKIEEGDALELKHEGDQLVVTPKE